MTRWGILPLHHTSHASDTAHSSAGSRVRPQGRSTADAMVDGCDAGAFRRRNRVWNCARGGALEYAAISECPDRYIDIAAAPLCGAFDTANGRCVRPVAGIQPALRTRCSCEQGGGARDATGARHTPEHSDPVLHACLLYTSDAADDLLCVDLGGRRLIKKKN